MIRGDNSEQMNENELRASSRGVEIDRKCGGELEIF